MDHKEPKTRKEKKGNQVKEVYNQKTIRLKAAQAEKRALAGKSTTQNQGDKK